MHERKKCSGKNQDRNKESKKKSKIYLTLGFTTVEAGEVLERRCMQEAPKSYVRSLLACRAKIK